VIRLIVMLCALACPAWTAPLGVPKCTDAAAQLEYAGKRKLELRGARGEARAAARERAVEAYRAVHYHFPRELHVRAEAAFREGELQRAGGHVDEAREAFENAASLGTGTEFRARGRLELGHLYRRAHRLVDALGAYELVAMDEDAAPRHRDRALLWRARLQARLGRGQEARVSWERVARDGFDCFDRLEAFDAWALHLIGRGDLEGAAGVLGLCGELLAERLDERTRRGERLRRTHARMKSIERLKTAIEARRKLREAEEAERKKSGSGRRLEPACVPLELLERPRTPLPWRPVRCVADGRLRPAPPSAYAVRVEVELESGRDSLRLQIPADRLREPSRVGDAPSPVDIEAAARELEASGAFNGLGASHVDLLVVDGTRPEPPVELIEDLLAGLDGAARLRVVLCTGTHDPETPANLARVATWRERVRRLVPRAEVLIHDARSAVCRSHGMTSRGTPVELAATLDAADRFIVLSDVKHHYFAGYSNPAKHFLPGCASVEAVRANHSLALDPAACAGRHPWHPDPARRANPVAEDFCEALELTLAGRPAHALVTIGGGGPLTWVGGGELREVSARAFVACDQLGAFAAEPASIVVVETGGAPYDDDLYTAQRALELSRDVRAAGARVLWIADCGAGIGPPSARENFVERLAQPLAAARRADRASYQLYSHKAVRFADYLADCEVTLASRLPEDLVRSIHLEPTSDPNARLASWMAGFPDAYVLVIRGGAHRLHLAR